MRSIRLAVLAIAAAFVWSCASSRVPIYIAPSNQTIETGTEMSLSGDGQIIFVHNHSTVPIMITGLHLVECENIKNTCDVQHVHIQVAPGQRITIATVRPENQYQPYSFRYNYSWEPVRQQ